MKWCTRWMWLPMLLGACASLPPPVAYHPSAESRVGVLVKIDGQPTHSHYGTTVFNNFNKTYPFDWQLDGFVREQVHAELNKAGINFTDLGAAGLPAEELASLLKVEGKQWVVPPERQALVDQLKSEYGLTAVVTLVARQERSVVVQECGGFGCVDRYAEGWGLYTRSVFGFDAYFAYPGLVLTVTVLDPPGSLAFSGALEPFAGRYDRVVHLRKFADPADFHNFTEAELQPVRAAIEQRVREIAAAIAERIKQG